MTKEVQGRDARVTTIENQFLREIFACETPRAVEAAITYASFLNSVGVTPENYPVFFRMLDIENHWVIDALIGDRDPGTLLARVQPNVYIVERILSMVSRWKRGGIFAKNLAVILGVLKAVYRSPREGFELHPLTRTDVNAIAKHLDKSKGQDDLLNRAILDLLDRLASLTETDDEQLEEVSVHASSIKNAFLDDRKNLEDVIPAELLTTASGRRETAPRKQAPFAGDRLPRAERRVPEHAVDTQ